MKDACGYLAGLPVKIADRAGLTDLLTSLRGSMVTVQRADGARLEGRVVGVEASIAAPDQPAALVLQHDDDLHVVSLSELCELRIQDPRAANDLRFFLDVSRTEQTADDTRSTALEAELTQLLDLQEQLRKNLGALGDSEREMALRNRLLDDLETSEERRRAIAATRREIEGLRQSREARQQALIDEIYNGA